MANSYQVIKRANGKETVEDEGDLRRMNRRLRELRSSTRGGMSTSRGRGSYKVEYEIRPTPAAGPMENLDQRQLESAPEEDRAAYNYYVRSRRLNKHAPLPFRTWRSMVDKQQILEMVQVYNLLPQK